MPHISAVLSANRQGSWIGSPSPLNSARYRSSGSLTHSPLGFSALLPFFISSPGLIFTHFCFEPEADRKNRFSVSSSQHCCNVFPYSPSHTRTPSVPAHLYFTFAPFNSVHLGDKKKTPCIETPPHSPAWFSFSTIFLLLHLLGIWAREQIVMAEVPLVFFLSNIFYPAWGKQKSGSGWKWALGITNNNTNIFLSDKKSEEPGRRSFTCTRKSLWFIHMAVQQE